MCGCTSGECCQWALDGVCKTIEWLRQPLGFDSLTLRGPTRLERKQLDNGSPGTKIKTADGVQYHASAPDDYRGFRVSGFSVTQRFNNNFTPAFAPFTRWCATKEGYVHDPTQRIENVGEESIDERTKDHSQAVPQNPHPV